jgi:hypothetical protein
MAGVRIPQGYVSEGPLTAPAVQWLHCNKRFEMHAYYL